MTRSTRFTCFGYAPVLLVLALVLVSTSALAQEADRAILSNIEQTAWATSAGTLKLSGLHMKLHKGKKECF